MWRLGRPISRFPSVKNRAVFNAPLRFAEHRSIVVGTDKFPLCCAVERDSLFRVVNEDHEYYVVRQVAAETSASQLP